MRKGIIHPNQVERISEGVLAVIIESDTHGVHRVMINESDLKTISRFRWGYWTNGRKEYAVSKTPRENYKQRVVKMHRLIMGFPEKSVDHKNSNGLDNRRENLRVSGDFGNAANHLLRGKPQSGFWGVYKYIRKKGKIRWRAVVFKDEEPIHAGWFDDPQEAAIARDLLAIKIHGEFAALNFPGGIQSVSQT